MYTPDLWVIVKIIREDGEELYKVLGTWRGGYLGGDSWRMNSGIKKVTKKDDVYEFHGYSGSLYTCFENNKGMNMYTAGVADNMIKRLKEEHDATMTILDPTELEEYLELRS